MITLPRTWTTDLLAMAGNEVRIAGWLHHQRKLARVSFVLVRDGRGIAQVVIDDEGVRDAVGNLSPETVVEVVGTAVAREQAPGGVEVHSSTLRVINEPVVPPPFELRRPRIDAHLPTILDNAAVALRHPRHRAIARIAAASVAGFRATLDGLGFVEINTPKIVGSATESGANVFPIDYFGRKAYLAQSPQLYKQMMVGVFERVFETGPVFRAEPHDTVRHLAQYLSLDAEMGFIEDHRDVAMVVREVVAGMVESMSARAAGELELLGVSVPTVPDQIPTLHFADAQQMIQDATGEPVVGESDLAPAHERWLGEWAAREHGSDFVFVEGYPMAKRPFYTHPERTRPEFSNSFDLLFRGLELVTGGQRLHRYDDYVEAAGRAGVALGSIDGYLAAFRHGMPPHGGFALGLERWVARMVGASNVREVTLFPRDLNRLAP